MMLTCPTCGTRFWCGAYLVKKGTRFCSNRCRRETGIAPVRSIEARNALAEAHLGLVGAMQCRYFRSVPSSVPFDDLHSAGFIGLLKAAERWDPARGAKFNTYACNVIWGEISKFLDRRPEDPASLDHLMGEREEAREDAGMPTVPSAEDEALAALEGAEVRAAVDALPAFERAVVEGIYWRGERAVHIAHALGYRRSSGSAAHHRALPKLAAALEGVL